MSSTSLYNTSERTTTKFSLLFFSILSFLSCMISIVVMGNVNNSFSNIFWIPLISTIMYTYTFIVGSKIDNDYINILIYVLYFIRNSFSIVLFHLAGYQTLYASVGNKVDINNAIILMCVETVIVFLYLSKENNYHYNDGNYNYDTSKIYKNIISVMLFITIVAYVVVPEIRELYIPIFGDVGRSSSQISAPSGGIGLLLYRIFNLFFPLLQLLVPIQLISYIVKRNGQTILSFISSFVITLTPLLFVSTEVAYSFIVFVALFVVLIQLYPKYKTIIILISSIIIVAIFSYIIFSKMFSGSSRNEFVAISDTFQGYFPGIINVSAAFKIPRDLLTSEVIQNEIIRLIPLRQFIFPEADIAIRSTTLFHQAIENMYQIMPNISMAYLHIGWFAPIISIVMIKVSKKMFTMKSKNLVSYASKLIIALYFAIGLVMYNFGIVLPTFSDSLIWILVLAMVSNFYLSKKE